ncbi:DUF6462 family protein [Eubacterium sp. AF17-7]|uniref:DUF6462 family protein n=1 Tax=Eubacterium sp. AF17-7 TaxID=2293105 RepID=UPI0018F62E15|nr:DUF6462 family protein [Eubacterium sp. AF17-7]
MTKCVQVMIRNQKIAKKFVRYGEGAQLYSMSQSTFEKLAKEAKAIYKYNKLVLVNTEKIDEYLELFHEF